MSGDIGRALLTPRVFLAAFMLYAAVLYTLAAVRFYGVFPNDYTWGELFINYEGGFLRRGLLGELLYRLEPHISVRPAAVFGFLALYLGFAFVFLRRLLRVLDVITVMLIAMTPTLLLFPARDPYVFGRKDIIIQVVFYAQISLCAAALRGSETRGTMRPALVFSLLYAVGFLVHEMALFYLPLPSLLLGALFARHGRIGRWVALMAGLIGISLAICFLVPGDGAARDMICASWTTRYPAFTCQGGLKFIGFSLEANIHKAFGYLSNGYIMSTVSAGLLLSAMPLVFLARGYRPGAAAREALGHPLLRLLLVPALTAPFFLSLFTNDFGRHIQSAFLEYVLFAWAVLSLRPQSQAPWLERLLRRVETSAGVRWEVISVIFAYGTLWRMLHCNAYGSFVQPGGVLKMFFDISNLP